MKTPEKIDQLARDMVNEWDDTVGPKELEDNEVGLNEMRYHKLERNLRKMLEED